jgi:hypothetical protein
MLHFSSRFDWSHTGNLWCYSAPSVHCKAEVLILVDSGSSTSFINQQLAAQFSGVQPLAQPCRVNVADGSQQRCSSFIPSCQWSAQGHQFQTDLKVLSLGAFDVILGMD